MRRPVVVPPRGGMVLARLRMRRREVVWWAAAIGLAALSVTVVSGALDRAAEAADRWGPTRAVWVTIGPVEVGEQLEGDDVRAAPWPETLAPAEAVVADPTGRTATDSMGPGEAVTERRLAPEGLDGLAALMPRGTRAVAVPTPVDGLSLAPGDLVDLVATDPLAGTEGDAPGPGRTGARMVAEATVVAISEATTTVGVRAEDLAPVVAALQEGSVTLARRSPLDARETASARPVRPRTPPPPG